MSKDITALVKMKFGSHLYGTNTPDSDTDLKGVHIPSADEILMQRVRDEISFDQRAKVAGERNTKDDTDYKSYSIAKFMRLASEGQTVAIDMLFAPDTMLESKSLDWAYIISNRDKLLTKKSSSFLGYCRQQADKYGIKGSRVLAADASEKLFSGLMLTAPLHSLRVGDYSAALESLVREHSEHLKIVDKDTPSGNVERFFECCGRKISYNAGIGLAWQMCKRISDGYGDRAKQAQENNNVDWKALSHAVRVGHEALELLNTGYVTFPLPNAEHVKDIKLGKLPYQQVSEEIENLLVEVEEASATSTLPDEPDKDFIHDVVYEYHRGVVCSE